MREAPHRVDTTHSITSSAQLDGARYPLLAGGTANDLMLAPQERVLFLTGPNMAGKSTLLRTLGLIVHFAHLGLRVPASRAVLPLVDRLITLLDVTDDIVRGESLYLAEVRRVRAVAAAVARGETVVGLLDEAFRGTNIKDATEATGLLTDGLAGASRGLFVLASHLVEVIAARTDDARIARCYMHVESDGANRAGGFTFSLRRGVSDVRLGMRLLEREGVVALLQEIGGQGDGAGCKAPGPSLSFG
ncbi:MAG TPA: hypothetical protein VE869_03165 [Gemmatimonas sp.]|nr:hypothetical protein [Gemmatimonas sp.]